MKNSEKRVIYLREDFYKGKAWGEVSMGGAVHREGGYRGNSADIIPNWSDICSTAIIPKFGETTASHNYTHKKEVIL